MSVKSSPRSTVKVPPRGSLEAPQAPPYTVIIRNRQRSRRVDTRLLKQIVSALLAALDVSRVELGIHLVAAKEMARVNRQFLQHTGSTDVITFDHSQAESEIQGPASRLHGELFVCVDDAVKQAGEFQTTWQSEVVRYVVHGVLHLLGYDDLKPEFRRAMKREENRLLRRLETTCTIAKLQPARLPEA